MVSLMRQSTYTVSVNCSRRTIRPFSSSPGGHLSVLLFEELTVTASQVDP